MISTLWAAGWASQGGGIVSVALSHESVSSGWCTATAEALDGQHCWQGPPVEG
jgi:hypothetical protein